MDENTMRLWLKDHQDAVEKLAQQQQHAAAFQAQVMYIPESLLIFFYILGLKLNLQHELLVSKPTTLGDAFSLARITEARLEDQSAPAPVTTAKPFSNVGNQRQSTPQRQELLNKRLCFNCDNRWVRGHKCPCKFLLLMTDEDDDPGDGAMDGDDDAVESGDISILNSLIGHGTVGNDWYNECDASFRMKKISLYQMQALLDLDDVYAVYEIHSLAKASALENPELTPQLESNYGVEDTAYLCLHSPKTTKERRSIRRIKMKSICRIEDIVCEYSGRYQMWSLLQETLIRRIQSLGYADILIRASRLKKVMPDKGKKSSMETFAPNDKADYYSGITSIIVNGKNVYEPKGKFLDDLHNNAFSETNEKDAVEHIEYYLKFIDPIKLPNVDHDKLRVVVFPISLAGGARRWFDRTKESITCWVDLTAKFFRKYYPPSRIEGNNAPVIKWDPANPKFKGWLATKFANYKTMDVFTKGALWDYWKMGSDEIEVSDDESSDLEEYMSDKEEIAEILNIETNVFEYETPLCLAFNEFNYLLKVDSDLLTKDIMGFKTYDDYKDDWIYEWNKDIPWVDEKPWTEAGDGYCNGGNLPDAYHIGNSLHYQDLEWYEALEDSELKDKALRNKAIIEGLISDDESGNDYWRRWKSYEIYYHI
ncbi:hypothetical protein Tco_0709411 [Tanacetum coccineum]